MYKLFEKIYNYLVAIRGVDSDSLETLSDQIDDTFDVVTGNFTQGTPYNIEIADGTTEQDFVELNPAYDFNVSIRFDLDTLETAGEGGVVTIRAYEKIDGSIYSDNPSKIVQYTVGISTEYPNIRGYDIHDICKFTIQLSSAVTAQRSVPFQYNIARKE